MNEEHSVVFALYPGITQLDFTAPLEVFARLPGASCVLASVDGGRIQCNGGITFADLTPLAQVAQCTLQCVPASSRSSR